MTRTPRAISSPLADRLRVGGGEGGGGPEGRAEVVGVRALHVLELRGGEEDGSVWEEVEVLDVVEVGVRLEDVVDLRGLDAARSERFQRGDAAAGVPRVDENALVFRGDEEDGAEGDASDVGEPGHAGEQGLDGEGGVAGHGGPRLLMAARAVSGRMLAESLRSRLSENAGSEMSGLAAARNAGRSRPNARSSSHYVDQGRGPGRHLGFSPSNGLTACCASVSLGPSVPREGLGD